MVSINRRFEFGEIYVDVRCLSTEEKPTSDIPNGSTCIEIDTGKIFMYDIDANEWREW